MILRVCTGILALTTAAAGLLSSSATANKGNPLSTAVVQTAPVQALPKNQALVQWAKIYEVFSHPRCANCHVGSDNIPRWSGPHYLYHFGPGQSWSYHAMQINAGDAAKPGGVRDGAKTLPCSTCHTKQNSPLHHGPPGAHEWALAPIEMQWWQKSSAEICAQIKNPARNGKRSLEAVASHVEHDQLVHWGWDPGPGREPAPYTPQEIAHAIRIWAASGAPCPTSRAKTED